MFTTKMGCKMQINSWLRFVQYKLPKKYSGVTGFVYVLGTDEKSFYHDLINSKAFEWQKQDLISQNRELIYFMGSDGPIWILRRNALTTHGHQGMLDESDYTWARDVFGSLVGHFKAHHLKNVVIRYRMTSKQIELGSLVGLEMGQYHFKNNHRWIKNELPELFLTKDLIKLDSSITQEACLIAESVNLSRHLVNLPPNEINPTSMKSVIRQMKWPKTVKLEIWDQPRLKKENMNLHLAVGNGSENPPCMIKISYRPKLKVKKQPIAFVGKGITFDTGGLDIKPSSAMRLMKKDMGGAAAVVGLAHWVAQSGITVPCDFYLALAENSVDGKAFRPSDVYISRAGLSVEIDNTDAEGRLVLADVLDVAATQTKANEPQLIIDVATLTGAIKVGLGTEIAGLFCNDDELSLKLNRAGQTVGDLNWRMPLYEKYFSSMSSPFADFKNSGESFGGAITAALFLQKFVRGKKWAHMDIYAWIDKAHGPYSTSGGSGQAVQCLIEFLKNQ